MAEGQATLITCPGKLGDLLYAMPLAIQIGRRFGGELHLQISDYCRPALELLRAQPYLDRVFIDQAYRLRDAAFGCQPWAMSEPPGYERVFHLGLRPELVRAEVFKRHLIETFFVNFERAYGIGLEPGLDEAYLWVTGGGRREVIVFNGYGKTFLDLADQPLLDHLERLWRALFEAAGKEVVVVTGPAERERYGWLAAEVICPDDLFETAGIIAEAALFVGVESAPAAVANGLKTPRLVLDWFGNARPTGKNGASFRLDEPPRAILDKLLGLLAAGG